MLNSGMKRIWYLVLLLNRKFLIPIQTALRQLISASLLKGCLVFGHYPHERSWTTAMYKLSKSHFSTNPNQGNILIKLRADGEFIRIRTFDRVHGGSRSFIVRREVLWKLPEGETAIDSDLDGFLEAFVRNEMVQMRFYWISVNNDVISGYKQSFEIPLTLILRVLNSRDMMAKYLYRAAKKPTRFHAVRAANTLRKIQQDNRVRRAFSKGMRDDALRASNPELQELETLKSRFLTQEELAADRAEKEAKERARKQAAAEAERKKICDGMDLTRNRGPHRDYINMMSAASCRALIDAVYEPHWAHYQKEFGTTIAGFFSDEPEIGNGHLYEVGKPVWQMEDQAWSDEVAAALKEALGPE